VRKAEVRRIFLRLGGVTNDDCLILTIPIKTKFPNPGAPLSTVRRLAPPGHPTQSISRDFLVTRDSLRLGQLLHANGQFLQNAPPDFPHVAVPGIGAGASVLFPRMKAV